MKVVLCFSGGLDSTTLLYQLRSEGHEVQCLGFDYGQTHRRELEAAKSIAADEGVPFEVVSLDRSMFGSTALTGAGESVIVPNRNAIFISMATAVAIRDGADGVAIGCNAGDHDTWPDCRPQFLDSMQQVLFRCHTRRLHLLRPLVRMTKLDIVRLAVRLQVPVEETWTCYVGGDIPCDTCVACVGRREALYLGGVTCTA